MFYIYKFYIKFKVKHKFNKYKKCIGFYIILYNIKQIFKYYLVSKQFLNDNITLFF